MGLPDIRETMARPLYQNKSERKMPPHGTDRGFSLMNLVLFDSAGLNEVS